MMQRRAFLIGAGGLGLAQLLTACRGGNQTALQIHILQNSLPSQLIGQFRQEQRSPLQLDLVPEPDLKQLFDQLRTWKQMPPASGSTPQVVRLTSLGDYWLTQAIQQELIQPLQPAQLSRWDQVPPRWQTLVTRDRQGQLSPTGQVWGAPYRWGATVMAYRTDKFRQLGWTPTDWSDLWRPELKRRFSLLDQPREVIGLTLKKLGHSYNTENLAAIAGLMAELETLNQQVKLYSSTNYLQPLIQGDTWLAVGWSTDILPVLSQYDHLAAVMPVAGTALWADVWVTATAPASDQVSRASYEWINFWWQPQIAQQLSQFTTALSPLPVALDLDDPTAALLLSDRQRLNRSEYLTPLSAAAMAQYRSAWIKMRR